MRRLAAIEARVTRYPASANDVVWLVERVRQLRDALEAAKRDMGYIVTGSKSAGMFSVLGLFAPGLQRRITEINGALRALEEPNLPVD